ncbi:MAG: foldase protein PrsA, partial [Solirubrobacteraceae bacterium]|nr:foldase protein PrsA [Solirubrobacteraceae bacterium]
VASVDGNGITRADFNHWMNIAAATSQGATGTRVAYNPPDFSACVATKRKTAPKPAKGQPAPTDAQFKTQCKQEYESLRDQVMQFLILTRWVDGEASDQGVKVSDKEEKSAYDKAVKSSFPKPADFEKFLKTSGMTPADARFQVRFNTVYTKLREKAVKNAGKVTDKAVADFYSKNKARLATPLTRDLRVVLTRSKGKADQAKAALASGQSWSSVAKKFSIDPASKAQGGVLKGLAKGQQEKAFDEAIFKAPKGKLTGPVKTQFGYYVFEVTKETPASQQSLKQSSPAIKQQLDAQNKQKADDKFNQDLRKKWKEKTNCGDGYVMTQCKNAPPEKTSTAPAGQTAPVPTPQQQP